MKLTEKLNAIQAQLKAPKDKKNTQITKAAEEYGEAAMIDVITRSMAANYKGIVFDWLKEASTRPAALGRAAKPGYGVQGHHDELNPMERAAVDRLLGPVSKGTGHGANDYLEGGE